MLPRRCLLSTVRGEDQIPNPTIVEASPLCLTIANFAAPIDEQSPPPRLFALAQRFVEEYGGGGRDVETVGDAEHG